MITRSTFKESAVAKSPGLQRLARRRKMRASPETITCCWRDCKRPPVGMGKPYCEEHKHYGR